MSQEELAILMPEEETEEHIDVPEEVMAEFRTSVAFCDDMVRSFRSQNPDIVGDSSFFDVANNLLSIVKSNFRTLERMHFKRSYDKLAEDIPLLKGYLALLAQDEGIRDLEFHTKWGALPEVRKEADKMKTEDTTGTFSSIRYYIERLLGE